MLILLYYMKGVHMNDRNHSLNNIKSFRSCSYENFTRAKLPSQQTRNHCISIRLNEMPNSPTLMAYEKISTVLFGYVCQH